ncbi:hypothetical protein PIB30_112865, partial [Stylosanthes scabra]|nr:hypothetical protein [Stylosanthes scabra]
EESTLGLSESILNTPTHNVTTHAYAWPGGTPSTHNVTTHAYAWLPTLMRGVAPHAYAWLPTLMRGTPFKMNSSSRESTLKAWSRFSEAKKRWIGLCPIQESTL